MIRVSSVCVGYWLAALALGLLSFAAHAGTTSYFIYDESGHVIGEYDQNGNPVQEHIYLGDRPVAVVTGGSSSSGTVDYVTTDQLNTPRVITDGSGAVIWRWNSDPFGNGQPTGSLTYDLRFPGQQYDSETGHNYNYLRDYDSTSGRYLESDFIGLRGGINTYLYVLDNPLSRIDAYGLCGCKICEDNYKKDLANAQDNFKSDTTAGCIFWEAIEDSNDCFDNAYKVLAASITLANLRRSQRLKDHGCPE